MTNTALIFVADRCPGGEMAVEKSFTNHIFIDLQGRDFKGLNWWFVSRRRLATQGRTLSIDLQAKIPGAKSVRIRAVGIDL